MRQVLLWELRVQEESSSKILPHPTNKLYISKMRPFTMKTLEEQANGISGPWINRGTLAATLR
ncbi:MAG: hypothetical protein QF682_04010 [Candidatus Thermoplasmatota archaeon]|nr:hypothetical protein [Candidatus Thermoplasmatota archaeon]